MGKKSLERLAQHGDRVNIVTADLSTADWRNDLGSAFDVAVSSIAIHNLRDPRRIREIYGEVFSVLNDGGFFVNFDYVRPSSPMLRPLAVLAGSDPEAGYTQRITGGQNSPGTIEEQLIWLREAGFTAVDCFWKEFHAALFGGFKGTVSVPEPA
jgi:tRNA (cmo5U34)-methyltransferase